MAGKKSVIETGVDKLVKLVNGRKKISVKDAAKDLGVSMASIEEWAEFLEEAGLITIQTKFATLYLLEKQISDKEIMAKLREMKGEKESFLRRVESSLNALQCNQDEIKMIDSEFNKIQSLLGKNFATLQKKLDTLEDFKKSHSVIDIKEREIERTYEKRLAELDSRLKKEQLAYESMLKNIDQQMSNLKSDTNHLVNIRDSQKELQAKVVEAHKLLGKVEAEIEKENADIGVDEERLSSSQKAAEKLKDEITGSASDLKSVTKSMQEARKEFERMEKDFKKDLELLGRGDLHKVGAYKESKVIMDKFQKFLTKSGEMKSVLKEASKEESELLKHFESVARKAQAMQVIAKSPNLKKDLVTLSKELSKIEEERGSLSKKMRTLRLFMRSVVK